MSLNLVTLLYLVASVCFIQALKGLSHPTSSIRGNLFGMVGMGIAVVTTAALIVKLATGHAAGMGWVLLTTVPALTGSLRLGARAEYLFGPARPRNGREAAAMDDFALQQLTHLYALNRKILLTPSHNMALMSPATTEKDVDAHTAVFEESAAELTAKEDA